MFTEPIITRTCTHTPLKLQSSQPASFAHIYLLHCIDQNGLHKDSEKQEEIHYSK